MPEKVTRKCVYCSELINIASDDYLKENKRYIHTNCFVNKEKNKRNPSSEEDISIKISTLKSAMNVEQQEITVKELFINYIQTTYDISFLPSYTFIKLSEIVKGTYKGLNEKISYEDLLYMFQTKQDFLNKNADKKTRQGTGFKDNLSRFNYDLAIIISKYDSYKEWKEKQRLLEVETRKNIEEENNKINFNYINAVKQTDDNCNNGEININDLLDEI